MSCQLFFPIPNAMGRAQLNAHKRIDLIDFSFSFPEKREIQIHRWVTAWTNHIQMTNLAPDIISDRIHKNMGIWHSQRHYVLFYYCYYHQNTQNYSSFISFGTGNILIVMGNLTTPKMSTYLCYDNEVNIHISVFDKPPFKQSSIWTTRYFQCEIFTS